MVAKQIRLKTERNCAYTAARFLRLFVSESLDCDRDMGWWRMLNELMRTVLVARRQERDADLQVRVERIEAALRDAELLR